MLQELGFSKLSSSKVTEGVLGFSFLFIFCVNVKKQNKITVPEAGSMNSSGTEQSEPLNSLLQELFRKFKCISTNSGKQVLGLGRLWP